jgi:hypothetical protein
MALNMVYASDVVDDAGSVLENIAYRGGLVSKKFLQEELKRLQGYRAADVINVAMVAMGKSPCCKGQATEAQMAMLVERCQKKHEMVLKEIAAKRKAQGK